MKKVYFVICLLVAMAGMIACAPAEDVQLGSQESDLASSEPIRDIKPIDIADVESDENIATFEYKGLYFLYIPKEDVGDIFNDTIFYVIHER